MRHALVAVLLCTCSSSGNEDCAALALDAQSTAQDRVSFNQMGCLKDSDCTTIQLALRCFKGCPTAVLASRKNDVLAELDAISSSACGASQCSVNIGCNPAYLKCSSGTCRMIEGAPDGGDGGSADAGARDGGGGDGG